MTIQAWSRCYVNTLAILCVMSAFVITLTLYLQGKFIVLLWDEEPACLGNYHGIPLVSHAKKQLRHVMCRLLSLLLLLPLAAIAH